MKLSKELLKEIYEFVNETLKAKIENEVPEMKTTFEVGKWYTPLNEYQGKAMVCIINIDDFNNVGYGFDFKGNYLTENYSIIGNTNPKGYRLATPEEVETALVNEAERRGFKEGVKYSNNWVGYERISFVDSSDFRMGANGFGFQTLCQSGNDWIFKNGTWATIINEPTEKELLIEKANKVEKELIELKKQIDLL